MLGVRGGSSRETGPAARWLQVLALGCVVSNQALGMDGGQHRKATSEGTWVSARTAAGLRFPTCVVPDGGRRGRPILGSTCTRVVAQCLGHSSSWLSKRVRGSGDSSEPDGVLAVSTRQGRESQDMWPSLRDPAEKRWPSLGPASASLGDGRGGCSRKRLKGKREKGGYSSQEIIQTDGTVSSRPVPQDKGGQCPLPLATLQVTRRGFRRVAGPRLGCVAVSG